MSTDRRSVPDPKIKIIVLFMAVMLLLNDVYLRTSEAILATSTLEISCTE